MNHEFLFPSKKEVGNLYVTHAKPNLPQVKFKRLQKRRGKHIQVKGQHACSAAVTFKIILIFLLFLPRWDFFTLHYLVSVK